MREILFRARRIDNGELVEGSHIKGFKTDPNNSAQTVDCEFICWTFCNCIKYYAEVQKETVRQYTGLIDKNGKKIFEGDIVKNKYGNIYKIFYEDCCLRIEDTYGNRIQTVQGAINHFEVEIIGNIHDNPELLEEIKDA